MIKRTLPIVAGIALFVFTLRQVDLPSTLELLKRADWRLCLAALIGLIIMTYLKAIRWSFLLKMQGYRYSFWDCFLVYMGSMYWGNITPGRAGDFVKVLYLREELEQPIGLGMTSVTLDRVFDLYILLIMGCVGILVYPMPVDPRLIWLVGIFLGILVFASLLLFNRRLGEVLIEAVFQKVLGDRLKEKARQAFEDFHRGSEAFYRPALLVPVLLSVASYTLAFGACALLAEAIGLSISVFYLAFAVSVVNIVSILTFLGMGTREGTLIILFGLVSLTREQALAYSLLLFFVGTVLFTLVCFLCSLLKPIRWRTLVT